VGHAAKRVSLSNRCHGHLATSDLSYLVPRPVAGGGPGLKTRLLTGGQRETQQDFKFLAVCDCVRLRRGSWRSLQRILSPSETGGALHDVPSKVGRVTRLGRGK
jgi:hypothetical protein